MKPRTAFRGETSPTSWPGRFGWGWVVLLAVVTTIAYGHSFNGVFVFDDHRNIVDNPRIRELGSISTVLSYRRPVVDLSLAVNYAIGGLDPRGYHIVNLAIHILAAWTLYGLLRRTLSRGRIGERLGVSATALAGGAALIWAVHPLQTQSVTYLIQRSESLMGLFYLLTIYCVVRGADAQRRLGWYMAAVASSALAMGSKAVAVTLPLSLLLFDRIFLARSFAESFRRRWGLYLGLAATWGMLVMTNVGPAVLSTSHERATVGFSFKEITPLAYGLTEPGVVLHYLRLALWPHPLCLDYDWPVAQSTAAIIPQALLLIGLAIAALRALRRRPWLGFFGLWFFLVLSPTSSIIPIRDPAFEHRMYLPLVGTVVLMVVGVLTAVRWLAWRMSIGEPHRRWLAGGLIVVVVATLAYGTFLRNNVYGSELTMWQNVIARRPAHARAYDNLGRTLVAVGRRDEGIQAFRKAVELDPRNANAHSNLGAALTQQGQATEAMRHYQAALRIDPRHANANRNMGVALARQGRLDEAEAALRRALSANILFAEAHFNLAAVLFQQGHVDEAIDQCRKALAINPNLYEAHYNLGIALLKRGEHEEAIRALREAVRLAPSQPRIYVTLARAYAQQGKHARAIEQYERALTLAPDDARIRQALATLRRRGS